MLAIFGNIKHHWPKYGPTPYTPHEQSTAVVPDTTQHCTGTTGILVTAEEYDVLEDEQLHYQLHTEHISKRIYFHEAQYNF